MAGKPTLYFRNVIELPDNKFAYFGSPGELLLFQATFNLHDYKNWKRAQNEVPNDGLSKNAGQ